MKKLTLAVRFQNHTDMRMKELRDRKKLYEKKRGKI
jgi:hypothetical protein